MERIQKAQEKEMKDIFGEILEVGDIVAFNPPRYKGLVKATITAFTPKMVRVKYNKDNTTVVNSIDVVKKKIIQLTTIETLL